MNGLFADLNDEEKFLAFVSRYFEKVSPGNLETLRIWLPGVDCIHTIDPDNVRFAHREYLQDIEVFERYLNSKNPDHYKRAGAVLHSLYKAKIIIRMELRNPDGSPADLSPFPLDAFPVFWKEFHNQAVAFDIASKCCQAYELERRGYDYSYSRNVCKYLKESPTLSVDSCYMLFHSQWALFPEK